MKGLVFAAAVLAMSMAASVSARADYAVVKFESGFCQIWWASATPVGSGWSKITVTPDYSGAWAALDAAIQSRTCL